MPKIVIQKRYEVEEKIGKGAAGQVFRARDLTLGKMVALKLIYVTGSASQRKVLRETILPRIVQNYSDLCPHKNLACVTDFFAADKFAVIISEFIDGPSLYKWQFPSDFEELRSVAFQIANAVKIMHDAGIVHRDIKPQNVIIGLKPVIRPVLVDFDLACQLQGDIQHPELECSQTYAGSPNYVAPEILTITDYGVDLFKADVYSLGTLFYFLFNKKTYPFSSNVTKDKLYSEKLNKKPTKSSSGYAGLDKLIDQMLDRNPDKRPHWDEILRVLKPVDWASKTSIEDYIEYTLGYGYQDQMYREIGDKAWIIPKGKPYYVYAYTHDNSYPLVYQGVMPVSNDYNNNDTHDELFAELREIQNKMDTRFGGSIFLRPIEFPRNEFDRWRKLIQKDFSLNEFFA